MGHPKIVNKPFVNKWIFVRLVLRDNELGDVGAEALFTKVLVNMRGLRELILANCDFTALSVQSLSVVLGERLPNLEYLNIAGNECCADGMEALAHLAATSSSLQLKNVDLSNCSISGDDAGEPLAKFLAACLSLQKLTLSHNDLGVQGAVALSTESWPGLANVSDLQLAYCGLDEDAIVALALGLRQCKSLEVLNLAGSTPGESGVGALAEVLAMHRTHLSTLDLSYAGLGPDAISMLAEAVVGSGDAPICLSVLHLRGNPLSWLRKL